MRSRKLSRIRLLPIVAYLALGFCVAHWIGRLAPRTPWFLQVAFYAVLMAAIEGIVGPAFVFYSGEEEWEE